jgi:hypothetical protein
MDSGPLEMLDPRTVAHVKHFERLTAGAEIQPPIRQGAINVQNE